MYLRRLRLGLEDGVPLVETAQDADAAAPEEVREDPFSSLLDGPRDSAADDGETERPPSPQFPVHTSTSVSVALVRPPWNVVLSLFVRFVSRNGCFTVGLSPSSDIYGSLD